MDGGEWGKFEEQKILLQRKVKKQGNATCARKKTKVIRKFASMGEKGGEHKHCKKREKEANGNKIVNPINKEVVQMNV